MEPKPKDVEVAVELKLEQFIVAPVAKIAFGEPPLSEYKYIVPAVVVKVEQDDDDSITATFVRVVLEVGL